MYNLKTEAVGCNNFISILKNAWPSSLLDFNIEDKAYYYENLIDFCNSSQDFSFTDDEVDVICSFLYKSLNNYLELFLYHDTHTVDIDKGVYYYLIFFEYVCIFGRGLPIRHLLSNSLKLLINFPKNNNLTVEHIYSLLSFYNKQYLFCKMCLFISRKIDLSINDSELTLFTNALRHKPQETAFCLSLYPFNNSFIKTNFHFYPDECTTPELFWGIRLGYFHISFQNNTYKSLIARCEAASDNLIQTASIDNPVYVFWNLSEKYSDVSLLNHRKFVDRLFRH